MADDSLIKTRYHFPGGLKISVKEIHNLPQKTANEIHDFFKNMFIQKLLKTIPSGRNICISMQISLTQTLYVDFYKNHLNIFIEDAAKNIYTQMMTAEIANRIIRKENCLHKILAENLSSPEIGVEAQVIANTIRTIISDPNTIRGAPVCLNKKIDDDFDWNR